MRAYELYRYIYQEAKKIDKLNHPKIIESLNNIERIERRLIPEDYRDLEIDEFIKNYKAGLANQLIPGTFYVEITFTPELLGSKIVISKDIIYDEKEATNLSNDQMGEDDDIGVLFFVDENDVDVFIMALKLRFIDQYEVIILE